MSPAPMTQTSARRTFPLFSTTSFSCWERTQGVGGWFYADESEDVSLSEHLPVMADHLRHLVHHVKLHPVCLKKLQKKKTRTCCQKHVECPREGSVMDLPVSTFMMAFPTFSPRACLKGTDSIPITETE